MGRGLIKLIHEVYFCKWGSDPKGLNLISIFNVWIFCFLKRELNWKQVEIQEEPEGYTDLLQERIMLKWGYKVDIFSTNCNHPKIRDLQNQSVWWGWYFWLEKNPVQNKTYCGKPISMINALKNLYGHFCTVFTFLQNQANLNCVTKPYLSLSSDG